ncbi:MAG: DUF177 domain-containing protein [Eggerthellaceae bacterium]|nr:DUF177 domain-containing protein [Eggerthellaceae bacterium]
MESTRIQIPDELFAPAESSHFEGEYQIDRLEVGPDEYVFCGPLSWQVDVTNTGEAFLVMGTVEGEAVTLCGRCLEEVRVTLGGEVDGYYLIDPASAEDLEDMEGDEFDVLGEDDVIDIEGPIRAALLLEIPLVPLCDEDCKGLCLSCGSNLNEGPCDCEPVEEVEEEEPANNPFAVLKSLKLDD